MTSPFAVIRTRMQQSKKPFPHLVLTSFVSADNVAALAAEWPQGGNEVWESKTISYTSKRWISDPAKFPPAAAALIAELTSEEALADLERITGIKGLKADPEFEGAGLHEVPKDGFLKIHADFNRHPTTGLYRRVNLFLYVQPDWNADWGGALELWDADMKAAMVTIPPNAGTAVLFLSGDKSYHGHPEPMPCPPGMSRKSIALYYYTEEPPPTGEAAAHTTDYQHRPGEKFKRPNPDKGQ